MTMSKVLGFQIWTEVVGCTAIDLGKEYLQARGKIMKSVLDILSLNSLGISKRIYMYLRTEGEHWIAVKIGKYSSL